MAVDGGDEFAAAELAAAVGVDDAAGDVTAPGDGVVERPDGELGGHAVADGVADDPVRPSVFDRAEIDLPLGRWVLGDVGEPDLVRPPGQEGAVQAVVVNGWAGLLAVAATLLAKARPPPVLGADLPDRPLSDVEPGGSDLVDEEPIPVLRVVVMSGQDRVGQVGVVPLGVGDRVGEPAVVLLTHQTQHPAADRDRDAVFGELSHEWEEPFPGRCACDK